MMVEAFLSLAASSFPFLHEFLRVKYKFHC